MRNRMYGGVRGRKTKVGEKLLRFPPTRFVVIFLSFNTQHLTLNTELSHVVQERAEGPQEGVS